METEGLTAYWILAMLGICVAERAIKLRQSKGYHTYP